MSCHTYLYTNLTLLPSHLPSSVFPGQINDCWTRKCWQKFVPFLFFFLSPPLSHLRPPASLLRCFREEKERRTYKLTKKNRMRDFGGTSVATDGIDIHDWVETVEHKGEKVFILFLFPFLFLFLTSPNSFFKRLN